MHRSFRAAVLATTALLFPAYAYAQGGIVQSGVVTRGHAPVWAGNGTLSDAGTATSSFISTLGITSAVFPSFAISTSSAVSPENILQMGVTSTGGTIDLENPGTTALPLIFENNGFPELTLDSTGTVHISSLIVGTISISSFSFANPTFTGSMLFTSNQVYNSPTIAVPSITNFVENLSGTIGGGTLSPKVPNPFYNTQTITNGVTLNNAGGAYGWHWKEALNNAVGTNSVALFELTQVNSTPADNGRTTSLEALGAYVTLNGTAGGTLPVQGLANGFVYGENTKVFLSDGALNYSLANDWGEGDIGIAPSIRPIFASGSVTIGETDTIELVSTACGFPGGIALTATAAAGDTLGILLNKFGSQILMNDTLAACGIGMALAGATSSQANTLDVTAPPNNENGPVDLTITFPPPSGGATAVYTLGTASIGASAQTKVGLTIVELKKDGVAGSTSNSVFGIAKQAGGAFPPTSGGWNNLVTFIGTTNQFSPDDTTVVPGQYPLDRLFNGVITNIPTQYAGTNDTPLQFPRMSSFLDLPNVEFLISDITTGLGPIVFPGYMLKGDGSEWIGSGTIQRLVGNAGTVGIQIQANGWEGTAIAVSNGGGPGAGTLTGHYYVNDITTCGFGDFEKVTATTATGGISTISVVNDGTRFDYPSSGPGSAPSATCHPLGGSGTGAVYTITWSAGNTVTVGNSGGTVNLLGVVNGGTLSSNISNAPSTSTGTTTARTMANRGADVINVKDMGAVGDGGQYSSTFAITSGLHVLTATDPVFANAKPGMIIGVPAAGATPTTGVVTAIPMVSSGDAYTGVPTISTSGSPTTVATVLPVLGLKSATVASGGTGCPISSSVTFTLNMTAGLVSPTLTMATDGSGNTTGSPTSPTGQWINRFPTPTTSTHVVGAACTVGPIFNLDIDVDHTCVGSTPGTLPSQQCSKSGYGSGYPLVGITASISGGSPGTPAVLGVPVITPYIPPLGTTIASVQNSNTITLTGTASTTLSPTAETVTYGTDDTAAIQAAVNLAALNGQGVYFPNSSGGFLSDEINLPSNTLIDGPGTILQHPTSLFPLLNAGANSHIRVQNVNGIGNLATVKNPNSGSAFFVATAGASDLKILHTNISQWTHHCISVDGVSGVDVSNNTINNCYFGAGVILSTGAITSAAVVHGNIVSYTQFAGVEAGFEGMLGGSITDNQITFGGNNGNGDSTDGHVSDCITGYTAFSTNELTVVKGNTMINCGNNALHWGGNRVHIEGNTIKTPFGAGIFSGAFPNSAPPETFDVRITGNHITGLDKTNSINTGINVRNLFGAVISDNTATNVYDGVEAYGFASGTGSRDLVISSNEFNTVTVGVWLRHKTQYSYVGGNIFQTAGAGVLLDNNSVSGDTSFASFFNTIGTNVQDAVTTPISEINGANFNTFDYQSIQNGSGANNLTGAGSTVQSPGGALSTFSPAGSYTFSFPSYATSVCYLVQGAGSSGANGHAQASGTATSAGAAGSAGALVPISGFKCVPASSLTSPVTVTVGAGGASPSGDGANGNPGGVSIFAGDSAFGGGVSSGGAAAANSASGASGSVLGVGHSASGTTAGTVTATNYNIAGSAGATAGGTFAFGGGSGAGSGSAGVIGNIGGASITGASGGGSGGGLAAVQVGLNGGAGGIVGTSAQATGGISGTNNGDAPANTCLHASPGLGGGGGGSQVATRGGNGATGCDGAGGGGGGSAGTGQTPGVGGAGGDGLVLAYWR